MKLPLPRLRRRVRASTRNALEIARLGRLGDPYSAPFEIVDRGPHHRLRRYRTTEKGDAPAVLLVPPLMLTAEVYDVDHDVSAVTALGDAGVAAFVVDFGAPEREEGGMTRTLDDHVRAVVASVGRIRALTGRDVHLAGYSQGGMFAYQAAAYLRSEGVKSVITFGSPVDIHRNLPAVRADVLGALVGYVEPTISGIISRIEGLPGFLTSTAFKLLSPRKELEQRFEFVKMLHDRSAIVRREARRRFLGGEGFVAWPAPALRVFVEEFVVHNRMLSGGFVIEGRTVTLADITCPVLAFVGDGDEIARPKAVRAIADAAPDARVSFVTIRAGHFGLVVGSRAMKATWPTVAEWILHREGRGELPAALQTKAPPLASDDELEMGDLTIEIELFLDTIARAAKGAMSRLGHAASSATDAIDAVRYQEPRLRRLAELGPDDRIGAAHELAEQARRDPGATFFLWGGRAFPYRDADVRVTHVAKGLVASGVRPGDRVGVVMGSRPSFLSMVTALNRIGAVAVIAPPDAAPDALAASLTSAEVTHLVSDPQHAERCHAATGRTVLVLGGGGGARSLAPGLVDMEAIDPAAVVVPPAIEFDAGRARDLAMILLRPGEGGELRAAQVSNHRWALSAFGAAASTTLKPGDTVYCCIPLHHPTGILASVGAALVGGARLAVAEGFDPASFLVDVRRTGATVVFYAGEMLRPLLHQAPGRGDRSLPVRVFAGSGMRPELAARLLERFGVSAIEFYAGTTQKVILAHASGEKPGALGRELPGSASIDVVRCDLVSRVLERDTAGRLVRAATGERGVLVAEIAAGDPATSSASVVEGAFAPGDRWFVSGDVVRRDADGDYWFVDALSGFVPTARGSVSTRELEDQLYGIAEVELAAAWSSPATAGPRALLAAFVSREDVASRKITEALAALPRDARPTRVLEVDAIRLTDGFRPERASLPTEATARRVHELDPKSGEYELRP